MFKVERMAFAAALETERDAEITALFLDRMPFANPWERAAPAEKASLTAFVPEKLAAFSRASLAETVRGMPLVSPCAKDCAMRYPAEDAWEENADNWETREFNCAVMPVMFAWKQISVEMERILL